MDETELSPNALEHRFRDIESRQRSLQITLSKTALDTQITYHLQLAITTAITERFPETEKEVLGLLECARQQVEAEGNSDAFALDTLIDS